MKSEVKLTTLDAGQLPLYTYNEELRANRVELVGSDSIIVNMDTKPLEAAIKAGFKSSSNSSLEYREIKVPEIIREIEIQKIEVPVIVKEIEYREIEKPIYITNIQIVEKPVMVYETKIIEVEKPIIIKQIEYKEIPTIVVQEKVKNLDYILIINVLITIGLVIKLFLKG